MRIVALGRSIELYKTIEILHSKGYEIPLIITCKAAPEYKVKEEDFKKLAEEINSEFYQTQNINSPLSISKLKNSNAEVGVSHNWISMVKKEACGVFTHGILNAHCGDLPKYRGNAPIAWAILEGEKEIGITIHRMDPYGLDSGPI